MPRTNVAIALSCAAALILTTSSPHTQAPALFDFHSAFWINEHVFLHALSRTNSPIGEMLPGNATPAEHEQWRNAVTVYGERHGSQSLLANVGLIILTGRLADAESEPSLEKVDISVEARAVLEGAAPVYRRYWWPSHDAANRRFMMNLQPLLDRHGAEIAARLAKSYGTVWPDRPIRVDVVPDASPPGNAHTTIYPTHIKIAAADPRHAGLAALELIFHEASHAWGPPLMKDVDDAAARAGKPVPGNLWHAILFFNAGFITADVLRAAGIARYEMYGDSQGVFDRLLKGSRAPMAEYWPLYLTGRISREEAVQRIVQDLR